MTDRGVVSPLSHSLTLGITALLVVGLVAGAGTFLENQREDAVETELKTIGNRLASEISAADAAAQSGNSLTVASSQPARIAGNDYDVVLLTGSDCDRTRFSSETCLRLSATDPDVTVHVPIQNDSTLSIESTDDGLVSVSVTPSSPTASSVDVGAERGQLDSLIGVAGNVSLDSALDADLSNSRPVAGFKFDPGTPYAGENVALDASNSTDPDGDIIQYRWDLTNDGIFNHSTTDPVFVATLPPRRQNITLKVIDQGGMEDTFTREVDVAGLAYERDLRTTNAAGTEIGFTVSNRYASKLNITGVYIEPENDSVSIQGSANVKIDGVAYGHNEVDDPPGGAILNLNGGSELDPAGGVDDTAEIELDLFGSGMSDENLTLGVKYRFAGVGYTNRTQYTDSVNSGAITRYDLVESGQDVDLVFNSTVELDESTLVVEVGGDTTTTYNSAGDFTETGTGTGPYEYRLDAVNGQDGEFHIALTDAETDPMAGTGEPVAGLPYNETTVIVTGDYAWTNESDWNDTTNMDHLINGGYGDRDPDNLRLGYTTDDSDLVGHFPFDDPSDGTAVDVSETGTNHTGSANDIVPGPGIFGTNSYHRRSVLGGTGVDSNVTVPSSPETSGGPGTDLTIAFWYNWNSRIDIDGTMGVKARSISGTGTYRDWFINIDDPVATSEFSGAGDQEIELISGYPNSTFSHNNSRIEFGDYSLSGWSHIVAVFHDNGNHELYIDGTAEPVKNSHFNVNGVSVPSSSLPQAMANTSGLAPPGEKYATTSSVETVLMNSGPQFIDELRFYNQGLSASEVDDLYRTALEGSVTTEWQSGTTIAAADSALVYDIEKEPEETVEVRVYSETSGGTVVTSNWIELDHGAGKETIPAGQVADSDDFRLEVRIDSPESQLESSPVIRKLAVVDDS